MESFSSRRKRRKRSMRVVIQRVTQASVSIDYHEKSSINAGYLILLGICSEDTQEDIEWLVKKIINLRVFDDEDGVMNRSIMDVNGEIMVVSQFTLYASYKKGNRPSWFKAAPHEISIPLYNTFCDTLSRSLGKTVKTGEFGANMQISLVNDGPVTICMDTHHKE
jgi:D-tyrosyl-tRNA(Tyr) deacylase